MEKIFPGPMSVMRWIEQEVAKAFKRGESQLTWTTPTGFVVTQKLNMVIVTGKHFFHGTSYSCDY